ncbi:MAG TPA: hypothetical protein DIT13_04655 [Verrucomicrobiales bacterium]|nr:hypothetical protein [Verrucomicrobiales bacterium]HRJ08618.1 DUF2071 domain-containing protein [Prosthecobacter sp.]HRK14236.1 DUF2071 domain-containing protein [Prosthecobacter sp.]
MPPDHEQREALRAPPARPFVMHQRWGNLLFLHWSFDPKVIQATLPAGLQVDTFEGRAWVGVVPFEMRGIRPRFCPPVPGVSDFLEMNLRTYVHDSNGAPGVWFYSLDCDQPLAVRVARAFFHLPYHHARMSLKISAEGMLRYRSQRRSDDHESAIDYRLGTTVRHARRDTLEYFLAERYLLYALAPSGLHTGRVHHAPYPLVNAEVAEWDTRLFALAGLPEPARAPEHVLGSPGVKVRVWALEKTGL